MDDRPKTLFKYVPFTLQSIQNLKRRSIYFGSPSAFNDPYDCNLEPRYKEITDVEVIEILDILKRDTRNTRIIDTMMENQSLSLDQLRPQLIAGIKKTVDDQRNAFNTIRGVSCFSEINDNILMWSHYGGQHRGFCLEFNVGTEPFTKLKRVKYENKIPLIDLARVAIHEEEQHILDLFCTKSIDWAYEREWRIIHQTVNTVYTYDANALKAIYFGAKMTEQDIDMLCLILNGQDPTVKLFRGHPSKTEFKIEFEPFQYTSLANAEKRQPKD